MNKLKKNGILILLIFCLQSPLLANELNLNFEEEARGTTVTFYGWGGDPQVNAWLEETLAPALKKRYQITMKRVGMNIEETLNKLEAEKLAHKTKGTADVIWINGENFAAAYNQGLLYGPFTEKLPNFQKYVDAKSPSVAYDFDFPTNGFEAPFGSAQLVFFIDVAKLKGGEASIPRTPAQLLTLAQNHPGQIAYAAPPDFTGSAFIRTVLCNLVPRDAVSGKTTRKELSAAGQPLFDYLKNISPFLAAKGKSYVATTAQLRNQYADGEVILGMSYTPFMAFRMIAQGEFAPTTRAFVFDNGTVANTHFLAIPFNAPNKAGAAALINLMLSPELQASKMDPKGWGDLPVIDLKRLSLKEQAIFDALLSQEERAFLKNISDKRIPELPAKMIPELEKLWLEIIP